MRGKSFGFMVRVSWHIYSRNALPSRFANSLGSSISLWFRNRRSVPILTLYIRYYNKTQANADEFRDGVHYKDFTSRGGHTTMQCGLLFWCEVTASWRIYRL